MNKPLSIFAVTALTSSLAFSSTVSAQSLTVDGPTEVAITFDGSDPARWLHSSAGEAPSGQVLRDNADVVREDTLLSIADLAAALALGVPGVDRIDTAAGRFPAFDASEDGHAAIYVAQTAPGAPDRLAPGLAPFTLEVEARLDEGETVVPSGARDNGNNLVQRGLSGGDQYKIEFDVYSGRPVASCTIRDEGRIAARVAIPVEAGAWYRVRCSRDIVSDNDAPSGVVDALVLRVVSLATGDTEVDRARSDDVTDLDFGGAAASVPLAVGGKSKNDGLTIANRADQFNGLIDNVYLSIG